MEHFAIKYLRKNILPTPFCPGCGNGIIVNALFKAIEELKYKDLNNFTFCSGIGCAAWIPSPHFKADTIHTLHGRAIPVATGIKMMKPQQKVIVIGGDGDIAGIGLNHLIHAARRNIEITVIMVNNMIYGMTGGQVAPTTPLNIKTTTTPRGNIEEPINVPEILVAAGAPFVAKWTTYHVIQLKNSIKKAIQKNSFAYIEVMSQCPTSYGKNANLRTPFEIMKWFKENSIPLSKAKKLKREERREKIVIGEYINIEKEGLVEKIYREMVNQR